MKDAEEEAVMCGTATIAGGYGQMVANPKYISSSEDRKLALKHYKNKQDTLKVSNLAIASLPVSPPDVPSVFIDNHADHRSAVTHAHLLQLSGRQLTPFDRVLPFSYLTQTLSCC